MYGHKLRRFLDHKPPGHPFALAKDHPAVVHGTTLFRARIVHPDASNRLLKSGHHSRKIGGMVVKGKWRGMPIFTLTLEERKTCPRSCNHWFNCYGNKMNWSERLMHGTVLEDRLEEELRTLARQHPKGFVVRLHVLGDFYSPAYVRKWGEWLFEHSELRVFGYTAWQPSTEIGAGVAELGVLFSERWKIRFSDGPFPHLRTSDDGIVCPAQTGKTECCGTCALCWSTDKPITFLTH